jgi:hypothetical protein
MAQYYSYNQGLDACDGVTEFESIRPSPLSETVPFFSTGTRSSTWPMQRTGSHDISYDYTGYEHNGGVNDRMHDAEPEANNSESIKPCEYNHNIDFQLLTRRSDIRAHRTPQWLYTIDVPTQDLDTSDTVGRRCVLPRHFLSTWLPHLSLPTRKSLANPQCELLPGSSILASDNWSLHQRSVFNHYINSSTHTSVHTPG